MIKTILKFIIYIICFLLLSGMTTKLSQDACIKIPSYEFKRLQTGYKLEMLTEFFDVNQHCWTSNKLIDEETFELDIPVLDVDINVHLDIRYGQIQEMTCTHKKLKVDCHDMTNLKTLNHINLMNDIITRTR